MRASIIELREKREKRKESVGFCLVQPPSFFIRSPQTLRGVEKPSPADKWGNTTLVDYVFYIKAYAVSRSFLSLYIIYFNLKQTIDFGGEGWYNILCINMINIFSEEIYEGLI